MFASAAAEPLYTDVIELDLGSVEPSLAGPKRPQDRVPLAGAKAAFAGALDELAAGRDRARQRRRRGLGWRTARS